MTPRDAWRCAGWALRLAAWSTLTQWGQTEAAATARTGVLPVRGTWRRHRDGRGMAFDVDGGAVRVVAVREWVDAEGVLFAVGDGCVWVVSAAKEDRR